MPELFREVYRLGVPALCTLGHIIADTICMHNYVLFKIFVDEICCIQCSPSLTLSYLTSCEVHLDVSKTWLIMFGLLHMFGVPSSPSPMFDRMNH